MIFAMVTMIYLILTMFAMVAMIYLFLFLQQRLETRPTHDTPTSHVSLSTCLVMIMMVMLMSISMSAHMAQHRCL